MMSAIGDAVHVLPVVTALERHDPGTRITWVLQPGPASLVRGHPSVDEIVIFDKRRGVRGLVDVRRALAASSFDVVLDLQVYFKASLVTALTRSPVKLGFDRARARDLNWLFTNRRVPAHAPGHVQDQYFEFLEELGVSPAPVTWNLGPWPEERERQRELLRDIPGPIATLVIGSSHPEKEWIPERWAELSDVLHERYGLTPVLAGGRSARELETAREIARMAKHPPRSTLGVPLRDLVGLIDASELVVSLDTAPLHVAVALERPVIALMGYNNPKRVGPYRRYRDLIVDAYGEPGENYPITIAHRTGRMPRIQVADVLEKVELWSRHYRSPRERDAEITRS
ncbi:MAG TPA: glycosyltransferase family 9 protein [Gemmatimonadaceae bacterium]|jgi:heptosyltransferase I|nr:glycosyltransferase family 9 protein [Gemmatimonadaceae bacterium]